MEEPFVFGANRRRWKYIAPLLVSAGAGAAMGLALLALLLYRMPALPALPPPNLPKPACAGRAAFCVLHESKTLSAARSDRRPPTAEHAERSMPHGNHGG